MFFAVLFMDNFSAHALDDVKALLAQRGIKPVFFPPNMTAVLQPLDVTLNKMFKARLRFLLMVWQLQHFDVNVNVVHGMIAFRCSFLFCLFFFFFLLSFL